MLQTYEHALDYSSFVAKIIFVTKSCQLSYHRKHHLALSNTVLYFSKVQKCTLLNARCTIYQIFLETSY